MSQHSFLEVSWTTLKALAVTKQLGIQYVETASWYDIYINEGVLVWSVSLPKDGGADVTDFENTYKALSNRPSFFLGQFRNKFSNLVGNGTTTVKSGNGVIRGVSINNDNTGGEVVIYDNTAGSGTKIATIQMGTPSGGLLSSTGLRGPTYLAMVAEFTTGLTVVRSGSNTNDITIYYV